MGVGLGDRRSLPPTPGSAELVIEAAHAADAHPYTCTANNSLGTDQVCVRGGGGGGGSLVSLLQVVWF